MIFFHCFSCLLCGQLLTVLNAGDRQPVAFSFLSIRSNSTQQVLQLRTDEAGHASLAKVILIDSAAYTLEMRPVGYLPYLRCMNGSDIKKLETILLTPDHIRLNEVVVTAQYIPAPADRAVQKIKTIDSKKIEAMGAVSLKDVLSNELNVRLSQDNILGAGMQMEGIGGENVKILIDGIPVIGRMNGDIDLSQINLGNIERIEIVEGPLSVQYGTNALAGTVNLITKKASGKKSGISVEPYYESIGVYNISATAGASFRNSSLSIFTARNYFDGWNPGDPLFHYERTHPADTTRVQQWKSKEQYQAGINYTGRYKKIQLGYSAAYFDEQIINRGMPRAPYYETAFDDHYHTTRLDNSVSLSGKLGKRWQVSSSNAFNYYRRIKNTFYKNLTSLDEVLSGTPSDQDTSAYTQLMLRATFARATDSTRLNYEAGYDLNYQSALGQRISNKLRYMGDYAVFATAEYKPLRALIIKPGLRYAYNTSYASPLTPSLSLRYQLNKNNTLRAAYANGFRAPDLKELYFYFVDINHDIIGNEALRAERSNNYTLSWSNKKEISSSRLRSEASLFYNDIFDLITLAQIDATQYSYINIGHYRTAGGSITESFAVKDLRISAGYAYTGRYNALSETAAVKAYSYSPEINASAAYSFKKIRTNVSVFYKYNGRLPGYAMGSANEIIATYTGDYQLLDASLSRSFYKERISCTIGCKNIFNVTAIGANYAAGVHASSATSLPVSTGRNYFIKLTFNLWKEK